MCNKILLGNIFSFLVAVNAIQYNHLDSTLVKQEIRSSDSSKIVSKSWEVILKTNSLDTCQMRIDFDYFTVGTADLQGQCLGGLYVFGQFNSNNVPVICGENDGQHIYVNFLGTNPIHLFFEGYDIDDNWDISVKSIDCSDENNIAPSDCLQYYTGASGNIQSFNFRNVSRLYTGGPTYQLSNTDYNICFGPPTNDYKTITWGQEIGTTNFYFIISEIAKLYEDTAGTIGPLFIDDDCLGTATSSSDFIEIQNGTMTDNIGVTVEVKRICGCGFPFTASSISKPFKLRVFTDIIEKDLGHGAIEGSIGFSLSYLLSE